MNDKTKQMKRRDLFKVTGGLAIGGMLAGVNSATAQTSASGEPIPLGSAVPLTGFAAADGIEFKRGVEMACDEINQIGGVLGRPLAPVFEDTKEQGASNLIPAIQRLIDRHGAHAIVCGYNTGAVTQEYDTVADAGIIYIHNNTDIVHHDTVRRDPERYFGVFMGDPAEYFYGEGILAFLKGLMETNQWERPNNKLAIITGSQNYSVVIANAIQEHAGKYGWDISLFETVVVPISEWGPTLQKIRQDPPAAIVVTHWAPQDLAQFMIQFVANPTDSLVYLQYGPSLAAFREIGREAANGAIYSTVIGAVQDEIGLDFMQRYKARFGEGSSPLIGQQTYDCVHYFALAAALAGGTGEPGNDTQNRLIANRLRKMIYRGVGGTTRFFPEQAAIPYPSQTRDPSLGMPHQFLQIVDFTKEPVTIAPPPYETAKFVMPPWVKA